MIFHDRRCTGFQLVWIWKQTFMQYPQHNENNLLPKTIAGVFGFIPILYESLMTNSGKQNKSVNKTRRALSQSGLIKRRLLYWYKVERAMFSTHVREELLRSVWEVATFYSSGYFSAFFPGYLKNAHQKHWGQKFQRKCIFRMNNHHFFHRFLGISPRSFWKCSPYVPTIFLPLIIVSRFWAHHDRRCLWEYFHDGWIRKRFFLYLEHFPWQLDN